MQEKEHLDNAINLIKAQDINGCITGSCLLDYFPGQDIDVFVYDLSSFNKLLFYMHYNPLFTILDPLEQYKFTEYINNNKSSLDSIGLITIKFKYNLLIDINVIFRKHNNNCFDVISNFDLDIIAKAYDITTKQTIDLRQSTGMTGTWNIWNKSFYRADYWGVKRILRQFERVVKYTQRGYDLDTVTDKYISLVEEILKTENIYKTEKGTKFYTDTIEQFQIVHRILQVWKETKSLTPEQALILKNLI